MGLENCSIAGCHRLIWFPITPYLYLLHRDYPLCCYGGCPYWSRHYLETNLGCLNLPSHLYIEGSNPHASRYWWERQPSPAVNLCTGRSTHLQVTVEVQEKDVQFHFRRQEQARKQWPVPTNSKALSNITTRTLLGSVHQMFLQVESQDCSASRLWVHTEEPVVSGSPRVITLFVEICSRDRCVC